jgi:Protein of unknown function (DUF2924)
MPTERCGIEDLADLDRLTRQDLRERWRRHFKSPPPRHASVHFLSLAIAYASQEKSSAGLSNAIRRELKAIAAGQRTPSLSSSSKIKPGTRLLREWHGVTHEVVATEAGFVWRGKTYGSLTAVAHAITGAKWNGRRFFGLSQRSKTL